MDPLPRPRQDVNISSGFRRIQSDRVSLGNYTPALRRPGQVYSSPRVQPTPVDTSRSKQLGSLLDSFSRGAVSVKKIMDTTKDYQNEEDLKEIDRFVSGLTAEQAYNMSKSGQDAVDSMVRRGEISGLQNPENYQKMWRSLGERAVPSINETIRKDIENKKLAVELVADEAGTASEVFSGLSEELTKNLPEAVREGYFNSAQYQRLQAQWIEEVNNKAEALMISRTAEGAITVGVEALRLGNIQGVQEALNKFSGHENSKELQQSLFIEMFSTYASEDAEKAFEILELLEAQGGVTVGTADVSSEGFDSVMRQIQRNIINVDDLKKQSIKKNEAEFNEEAKNVYAGQLLAMDKAVRENSLGNAQAIYENTIANIEQDEELSDAAKRAYTATVSEQYQRATSRREFFINANEAERGRERQATQEQLDDLYIKSITGEASADEIREFVDKLGELEASSTTVNQAVKLLETMNSAGMRAFQRFQNQIAVIPPAIRDDYITKWVSQQLDPEQYQQVNVSGIPTGRLDEDKIPLEVKLEANGRAMEYLNGAITSLNAQPLDETGEISFDSFTKAIKEYEQSFLKKSPLAPAKAETPSDTVTSALQINFQKLPPEKQIEVISDIESFQEDMRLPTKFIGGRKIRQEAPVLSEKFTQLRQDNLKALRLAAQYNLPISLGAVGPTATYSNTSGTGAIQLIFKDNDLNDEERISLFASARATFEKDHKEAVRSYLASELETVLPIPRTRGGRIIEPRVLKVAETTKESDLKAMQYGRVTLMELTAEEITNKIDREGLPLPEITPEINMVIDIEKVTSMEDLMDKAEKRAAALDITTKELLDAQSLFWGSIRYKEDPALARAFDIRKLFE